MVRQGVVKLEKVNGGALRYILTNRQIFLDTPYL